MTFFIVLITYIFFVWRGAAYIDPDLGWHIKTGEYILNNGIPRVEAFTFTMPSFPWIDHEWITNVLLHLGWIHIGHIGLAFIFGIVATLALIVAIGIPKSLESKIIFLLAAATILPTAGVRPQLLTWAFISILVKLLYHEKLWERYKYVLPFLFLIWVNMHGAFASGIVIFTFYFTIKTLRTRKLDNAVIAILALSIFATMINPYGINMWKEAVRQFIDSGIYRRNIVEWMPIFLFKNYPYMVFVAFHLAFLWMARKYTTIEKTFLGLALLYQGASSVRHMPLYVITVAPLIIEYIQSIEKVEMKSKQSKALMKKSKTIMLYIVLVLTIITNVFDVYSIKSLSEIEYYPKDAIAYLKKHPFEGNLFNEYGWGGYLVLHYPEKKVFIDGRMTSMKWTPPNSHELSWGYITYINMTRENAEYKEVFDQFNITRVLIPNRELPEKKQKTKLDKLVKQFYEIFIDDTSTLYLQEQIENNSEWEVEYKDDVSILYAKKLDK